MTVQHDLRRKILNYATRKCDCCAKLGCCAIFDKNLRHLMSSSPNAPVLGSHLAILSAKLSTILYSWRCYSEIKDYFTFSLVFRLDKQKQFVLIALTLNSCFILNTAMPPL